MQHARAQHAACNLQCATCNEQRATSDATNTTDSSCGQTQSTQQRCSDAAMRCVPVAGIGPCDAACDATVGECGLLAGRPPRTMIMRCLWHCIIAAMAAMVAMAAAADSPSGACFAKAHWPRSKPSMPLDAAITPDAFGRSPSWSSGSCVTHPSFRFERHADAFDSAH